MAVKSAVLVILVAVLIYKLSGFFITDNFDGSVLVGKNIIITGASSGIGEQLAYQYAQYGANVFITARREHRLQEVIEKCKSLGNTRMNYGYLAADMARKEDREKVIKAAIQFFGDIDQLILNHALLPPGEKWSGSHEQLERLDVVLNVNMASFVHLTAAALPSLRNTSGSVCIVGSGSGRLPTPYALEYVASKFALDGFFTGLSYEFEAAKENISITHCILGYISTEAGTKSFQKLMSLFGAPAEFMLNFLKPGKHEDAAQAILIATTQRQGELYFPSSQMIWVAAVFRSIFPELHKRTIC